MSCVVPCFEELVHQGPEGEPIESDPPEDQDLLYLTCQEPTNEFTCEDAGIRCWTCEFDMNLKEPLASHTPGTEESWLLLATTAKKQRTEVKLSSLSAAELAESQKAKQAEVENWITTGTIRATLRNQIPEEQILRRRWILTWEPLDAAGQNGEILGPKRCPGNPPRTHKPRARLVVLGY